MAECYAGRFCGHQACTSICSEFSVGTSVRWLARSHTLPRDGTDSCDFSFDFARAVFRTVRANPQGLRKPEIYAQALLRREFAGVRYALACRDWEKLNH